ncbi:MAG: hypothetical protein JSW27_05360 [Phycisphaerales bacterium]|nr:MAG: hypothetical protein JSW27_05360 [Phycisphaerales bacterium]
MMNVNVRKIAIGLVVLGVLVLVYMGYLRVDESPNLGPEVLAPEVVRDPLAEDLAGTVGQIGDVGIRKVERPRFFHTDASGNIDREFGFEELIHSEEDQWVITNPYMRLFLGDILCRVTADEGNVQLETSFGGQPVPDDATFTGNVVIRIIPSEPNDPQAVFIYLDDVAFIADQSLFTTTGAVKFVSRQAQLVGRGMELLYDESARQLRLFRIKDLDALRLRSTEFGSFSDMTRRDEAAEGAETTATETAVAGAPSTEPNAPRPADNYECIFYRNVTITTPDQKITARDRLAIDNIMWSSSAPETDDAETSDAVAGEAESPPVELTAQVSAAGEPNESESIPFPGPDALDTSPSEALVLDAIPESFFDIVVTCDNGFVVAPKGSRHLSPDPSEWNLLSTRVAADANEPPTESVIDLERQTAIAQRIDFDATTTDTTLLGPVTMTFALDANDLTGRDSDKGHAPVTITAQEAVRYVAADQRIQLEGNCAVTLQQTEPNYTYEYMLTAPRLAFDLMDDPNASADSMGITLRQFVASGGPVAVHALRKAGADLVGWVELKASKLDYQAGRQEFVVSGPAKISLHNGEDLDTDADPNEFSIGRPCFAFMHNFDVLTYSAATNTIVADAETQQIFLDYYPQVDGSYDERFVQADAGRIEIALTQTAADRVELASIKALGGISFVDNDNEFEGAQLVYDHAQDLVTVVGDEALPCYLNGALVDRIEMNPKTGAIKTKTSSPSILQINR